MAAINPIANVPVISTVYDAMVACGVNDAGDFNGDTPAVRIATDLFGDDFATCMDKSLRSSILSSRPIQI
jgi:hypothetical protein